MIDFNYVVFKLAIKQHQRRRDKKFNITYLINLLNRDYMDYCMEAWIAYKVEMKKK